MNKDLFKDTRISWKVKGEYLAIGNARNEKGQFDYCYYRLDK